MESRILFLISSYADLWVRKPSLSPLVCSASPRVRALGVSLRHFFRGLQVFALCRLDLNETLHLPGIFLVSICLVLTKEILESLTSYGSSLASISAVGQVTKT